MSNNQAKRVGVAQGKRISNHSSIIDESIPIGNWNLITNN